MPGDRPTPPWRSWTAEQWQVYRAHQVAAVERFGEPWATNVGRSLVTMADWHLAQLGASVPA